MYQKSSKRKEIVKTRVEINNIETKTSIQRLNETESWF